MSTLQIEEKKARQTTEDKIKRLETELTRLREN
jgi:hypothetical protein